MIAQIAAQFNMCFHHVDFRNAFLNSELERKIYVNQPLGFEVLSKNNEVLVCVLKRSLYGLVQSSRNWNKMINSFLKSLGFIQSYADACLYTKIDGDSIIILCIWVDDILMCSNNSKQISIVKQALGNKFRLKDLGMIEWFLGIHFNVGKYAIQG